MTYPRNYFARLARSVRKGDILLCRPSYARRLRIAGHRQHNRLSITKLANGLCQVTCL
jgi:hypothetical protein